MAGTTERPWRTTWERWRLRAWVAATMLILLVPLAAMQVTDEVAWTVADFAFAGTVLIGAGVAYEIAARKTGMTAYRAAAGVALAAAVILVWVNGAVGIIGTEDNAANLMYGGVLAVGVIGAVLARFRADGMARALFATALAQALVAVIALTAGLGTIDPTWPLDIVGLTAIFAALWLASAWLFRQAAREQPPAGTAP